MRTPLLSVNRRVKPRSEPPARTRDGDYARSGYSRDEGAFLGDASIGVAYRRGAMQGSLGVVYREIETEGVNFGPDVDTDVDEGLIAFQFSIRPN